MNAIEQYIKGEGKDEGNLKPKTVMECYLSGVKRPSFPKYSQVIEAYLGNKYAFDAWKEEDHPRDKDGKFGKGGGNVSEEISEKRFTPSLKKGKIKYRQKYLNLPKDEYARVHSAFFSQLSKEEKNKKIVAKCVGSYKYVGIKDEDGLWKFIKKVKIL
jgi:hypothetical protein